MLPLHFVITFTIRFCLYNSFLPLQFVSAFTIRFCLYNSFLPLQFGDAFSIMDSTIRCYIYNPLVPFHFYNFSSLAFMLLLLQFVATFSLQGTSTIIQTVSSLLHLQFVAASTNRYCLLRFCISMHTSMLFHSNLDSYTIANFQILGKNHL